MDSSNPSFFLNLFSEYEGVKRKWHIPEEKLSHGVVKPEPVDQNRASNTARDPFSQFGQGDSWSS